MNEIIQQKWFAIEIEVAPEAAEAVEFAFNSLESLGTEINHLRKTGAESVTVIGYFSELPDDEAVQDELHYALRSYGLSEDAIISVARHEIADADWLHEWKKHWKPTEIGKFIITPPWENVESKDKIVIRIEPNMAFGTGTHETTQLCLKAIGEKYETGQSFLDVGTGTGILAIAAAKIATENTEGRFSVTDEVMPNDVEMTSNTSVFSVANILACDTDADSIKIAKENADINGVGDEIEFRVGPISDETPQFDFVCANLALDVISPILSLLLEKTRRTLVLSGILTEQESMIVSGLRENGVEDFVVERDGEWIGVIIDNG